MKEYFLFLLAIPIGYIILLRREKIEMELNFVGMEQNHLKESGQLLNADGSLVEVGWAKTPIKQFDSNVLPWFVRQLRYKQWDFYQVSNEEFYFSIAFVDLGFTQNIQVTFNSLQDESSIHKSQIILPLIHDRLQFSDSPTGLDSQNKYFSSNDLEVSLISSENQDNIQMRYLNVSMKHDGKYLNVNLRLKNNANQDSIVTVTPINGNRKQFFYNQKTYNGYAKGQLNYEDEDGSKKFEVFEYNSNSGSDWGRGVWNYHTFWLWASAMGFDENGQRFGLNLGGGFQDRKVSKATEESLFINKVLYKLKDLTYEFDEDHVLSQKIVIRSHNIQKSDFINHINNNQQDQLKNQLQMVDSSIQIGDFYCEFEPFLQRIQKTDLLIVSVNFDNFLGAFNGYYLMDSGKVYQFKNITGIIEFNKAYW